ncbi:MAG: aminotransferase class I/II-fold pyridoxal phosphate-dependent enzyme [Planctomycetota bacterium]
MKSRSIPREKFRIPIADRMTRLPPYLLGKVNTLKQEKRRQGVDVIDLGMGNPNDPPPGEVLEKIAEAVRDPRNHRYSVSRGIVNLRREVAAYYRRTWGVTLDGEKEVVCCVGSKEGFSHLCLALLGPGDTALVPSPAYPIHDCSIMLAGANVIRIPLGTDDKFIASVSDVAKNLYPHPRLLVINFPHNPTASTVDVAFFEEIVKVAKRRGFLVVHDFAYGEINFDGYKSPSFLQARGARDVGVELTTMSKTFSMPGWRIGYCSGNREMIRALSDIKSYYDYGIFQAIQISAIVALRRCEPYKRVISGVYQRRRDVLIDGLNRIGWKVEKSRASMFVWVPIPEPHRKAGSVAVAMKMLDEAHVAVFPGLGFGEEGEGHIRIALVENEERLRQAVRQIKKVFPVKE